MKTIDVAETYSPKPYGRHRKSGDYSAERFREEVLLPIIIREEEVLLDFSGSNYWGSSFLEEVFGGLVRENGISKEKVLRLVKIKHSLLPSIEDEVKDYIEKA